MVTLTDTQAIYVRELLFEELHEAAETRAEQANGATQGNAEEINSDGDDAHSTWRSRLMVVGDLLDTVGWSVATDTAIIVGLERKRRGGEKAA